MEDSPYNEATHYRELLRKFVDEGTWHEGRRMWVIDLSRRPRISPEDNMLWLGPVQDPEKMTDYGIANHFRLVQVMFRGW